MKMSGRRESSNVDDRRGGTTAKRAGSLSLGGILIGLAVWYFTGNSSTLQNQIQSGMQTTQTSQEYTEGQQEATYSKFARQVLAGTEDVWDKIFKEQGWGNYSKPAMVLYRDQTSTACGTGTSSTGPFYCPGDQKLYIDLSFFDQMEKQMKAGGDFAYAYVVAHEVGHHVQYLTGINQQENKKMQQCRTEAEANQWSVRQELQADFLAGIWAHYDNQMYNSIEDGDIEEGINCAQKIGDDYLQKQAGYREIHSDLFTHGTSAQRMKWFKLGLQGDMNNFLKMFECNYNEL